ncbi:28S ribosomal protein S18c, mitochondrial-like isoform X2 [Tupaia chinensis]|uniref:28S ribosomal protein S18c, mitochondrial-like isoform X2 n=1 Tax=Tupaia chinensis TaxID=246437 RepID=UPI00070435F8|nr:28S ribosomal protein S18c, mitochondrial-like isoform X2 [Tupaia chinensis]
MAAAVAVCSGLGRTKLTHLATTAVCAKGPGAHEVLWRRGCSQYRQETGNEDLSVFVGRNRKKSQKQLRELK